jgi:kynurenine formamidase
MKPSLIDVCHTIHHGMITYKGFPSPVITDHLSREDSRSKYEAGTEFHIGKIEMVANTGTYVDAPFHRYAEGKDLSELELSSVANLDGVVVRCANRPERAIGPDALERRVLPILPSTGVVIEF